MEDKVFYRHYYDQPYSRVLTNKRPLVTVCYIKTRLDRDDETSPLVTRVGFAICSPKDNPSKKKGRELAYERALNVVTTLGTKSINTPTPLQTLEDVGLNIENLANDGYLRYAFIVLGHTFTVDKYYTVTADIVSLVTQGAQNLWTKIRGTLANLG